MKSHFLKALFFFTLTFFMTQPISHFHWLQAYKYDLGVCAIFQDEAPYLKEWIEFHKLMGVQHFYLYNNLSKDNYMDVLHPYIISGEVDLLQWPYENTELSLEYWNTVQCKAYTHALQLAKTETKWVAFIDTDEYVFPVQKNTLIEFLSDYEDTAGICVNWQCYGTSHITQIPAGKLMIEVLLYKCATDFRGNPGNEWVKSIVRPEFVVQFHDPHFAVYKPGYQQVNANKEHFEGKMAPSIVVDKIRINHYWTRNEDFFIHKKLARRGIWGASKLGCLRSAEQFNHIKDDAILRFAQHLKAQL